MPKIGPLEGPGPKITWPGGAVKEFGKEIIRVFKPTIVGSYAIRKIHETIIREIILFRGTEEIALTQVRI